MSKLQEKVLEYIKKLSYPNPGHLGSPGTRGGSRPRGGGGKATAAKGGGKSENSSDSRARYHKAMKDWREAYGTSKFPGAGKQGREKGRLEAEKQRKIVNELGAELGFTQIRGKTASGKKSGVLGNRSSSMSYKNWMKEVDAAVSSLIGVGVNDLADFRSRDMYDDEVSPEEAAREAIRGDDLGSMFFPDI